MITLAVAVSCPDALAWDVPQLSTQEHPLNVTKYPQSCLVLDNGSGRILIDPGNLALDAYSIDDFGALDAVLYTHRHADHFDERHVDALRERGLRLYGNADVCSLIGEGSTEVSDGVPLEVAGFGVTPRDLPHATMVDGSAGPPNTGYVVDGTLFHPGDGTTLEGLEVAALAVPIVGPSISFRDAYRFTESVGAEKVIPIHYDTFLADPDQFAGFCDIAEVVVLGHGESVQL